ncbi:MAG: 23S rRNA (guanosine(2251)-2'-O)-methyltransferase RlmB [Mycoplasmataceae bacterium]|nr:23S rRNA (guanosine(2251)-2'-O)-methyltransferase RlmB [Mycoplasmataceae bacterium]
MLIGKKALINCIENGEKIKNVILNIENKNIIGLLKKNKINYKINNLYFKKINNVNHQGVIFFIDDSNINSNSSLEKFLTKKTETSIVLMLDSILDPHNFGAILRTCDAFGVDAVIYKKDNQAQINEHVIKTSMGATKYLNLFRVNNLSQTIDLFKKNDYWIFSSALSANAIDYSKIKYDKKIVVIVGNEENGICQNLLKKSDHIIKIPMFGNVQSLNVSVSTGILLSKIING